MPAYDFRSPRLFVAAPLAAGAAVPLDRAQGHYLTTVLRLKPGAGVLVFNGRDGEWSAVLEGQKRDVVLALGARVRDQTVPADLHYLFAPLKSARKSSTPLTCASVKFAPLKFVSVESVRRKSAPFRFALLISANVNFASRSDAPSRFAP